MICTSNPIPDFSQKRNEETQVRRSPELGGHVLSHSGVLALAPGDSELPVLKID